MEQTGVVFDIQKFSIHDGYGIRTTVFLKGCACGAIIRSLYPCGRNYSLRQAGVSDAAPVHGFANTACSARTEVYWQIGACIAEIVQKFVVPKLGK